MESKYADLLNAKDKLNEDLNQLQDKNDLLEESNQLAKFDNSKLQEDLNDKIKVS